MLRKFSNLLLALFCCAGVARFACAHDPGLSTAVVDIAGDRVQAVVTFAPADIEGLFAGRSRGAEPDPARAQASLAKLAPEVLVVVQGDREVRPANISIDADDPDNIEFRLTYIVAAGEGLTLRSPLIAEMAPGHRQFLTVLDAAGRPQIERLLKADAGVVAIGPQAMPAAGAIAATSFAGFLTLGIEHILTGYDHLLFLAVLLVATRTFVDALKIITCFTLAHSITLALATFNVIHLPGRIVEPLIAASIVYVSAENLLRGGQPRGRWLLTFGFGLVHGLGFASVLREMGVGADGSGVWMPLLAFNLGVELGQIGVAAVLLPLFLKLGASPLWSGRLVPACSIVIAMAGGYWLVERLWPA